MSAYLIILVFGMLILFFNLCHALKITEMNKTVKNKAE